MESPASEEFNGQLVKLLPTMRIWALALTKHPSTADDLVQDVAAKVLTSRARFEPGTNFAAWVHRIMVNRFITTVRARREVIGIEEMPDVPVAADQQIKLDFVRLHAEIARLPDYQRDVLYQIAVERRSYEEVSKACGCAVGTLKSRLHRIRLVLRARLEGHISLAA